MSQYGCVVFYTTHEPNDPRRQLADLLAISGQEVTWVARWRNLDRSWWNVRNDIYDGQPEDHFAHVPVSEVASLYLPPGNLLIEVKGGERMDRIHTVCLESIPEDVRGRFSPWNLHLRFGWHDVFECEIENVYMARAFCAVCLFGYGCPPNWARYRELVFQVPEIIEAKQHFETVLGPLETCATWDV